MGCLLFIEGRVEEDQQQTATELCIPISAFLFVPLPYCHSNTKKKKKQLMIWTPQMPAYTSAGIDGVEKSQ